MGIINDWILEPLARHLNRIKITEAAGIVTDEEEGFQRLGEHRRDTLQQDKVRELDGVAKLYIQNAFVKWQVETMRDMVLAEGVSVESDNEDVQQIINKFWNHPINNMPVNLPQIVLELFLYGDQALPAVPGPGGGTVLMGSIEPGDIERVVHDPDNSVIPIGIERLSDGSTEGRKYSVIYNDDEENLFAEEAKMLRRTVYGEHQAFWFKVNGLRHQTRGRSSFYSRATSFSEYDDQMHNASDRTGLLNAFAWDIEIQGATDPEVKKWAENNGPPAPGSNFVHNEKIKMEPKTPDLKAFEMSESIRMLEKFLLGTASMPLFWFGSGDDTNRSTSENMGIVPFKRFTFLQKLVFNVVDTMILFQLRHSARAGLIPKEEVNNYKVTLPHISTDDLETIGNAVKGMSAGLLVAEQQEWVTGDQAREVFAVLAERTGVEITMSQEESESNPAGVSDSEMEDESRASQRLRAIPRGGTS